jgi:RNA polymerase sigma-70 factor (ECF subfamily)
VLYRWGRPCWCCARFAPGPARDQIACQVVSDYYRAWQRQVITALPDDLAERLMEPEEDEGNEAVQSLLPCILPLVQRLPQPYRHALLLTEVEGMSQEKMGT